MLCIMFPIAQIGLDLGYQTSISAGLRLESRPNTDKAKSNLEEDLTS